MSVMVPGGDTVRQRRIRAFRGGFVATMPLWLGIAPFGAIFAVNAHTAGLSAAQTIAMSLVVFAGASQFVAVSLFATAAAPLTVVLTTFIINLRHLLFAASLAPHLRRLPTPLRALLAFGITDESYAIGTRRFLEGRGSAAYQLGSNASVYLIWQASTVAGLVIGSRIPNPSAYGLDLVFPLTFISLLMPLLRERMSVFVALVAALLTIVGALVIPGRWYILLAGVVASSLGAGLSANRAAAEP